MHEPLSEAHPPGRGLQGLSASGPVVLYDESFDCLVVSPLDHFKSAVHYSRGNTSWETGVSSELASDIGCLRSSRTERRREHDAHVPQRGTWCFPASSHIRKDALEHLHHAGRSSLR